ncbi:hypothetical protein QAD02_006008 [Eretmocerus hayati]|uniref:Uncharacterized protein n=1 Tax=Eretmocerus hayati TaxID=131215 RepID=A0ACC2N0V6_9HYME|nr:hypothetical protein QAD02_006008 [Eretmocerus hayati]
MLAQSPGPGGGTPSPELCDKQKLLPSIWNGKPAPIILPSHGSLPSPGKSPSSLSFRSRSRYRAGPSRKLRRRAVLKSGECNVLQSRISRRSLRFLQDIFTTLVDTQWRWTLLCFALSFILSWLVFASIWYLIAFTHGDFDPRHLADESWQPCVSELHSFTSCFLFSIETQHTIGYGGRSTTEECPEAIFVMCVQSISGVMIQALMVGIVFAKMSRPKQRTQTLLFSKQAVICQRDGELCLMFRVGDMRKSHIIGATVRAQLIRSRTTREGELLPHNQVELAVGADGQEENLFFIWPCTVVHRINSSSPFYNMSAEDMLSERFEIVVILEGTIESTGQTTQARSSYLPQEVLWGHRFEPIVSYSKERQGYEVDYSRFNSTLQVDTPLCSGRELAEFYRLQDGLRRHNSSAGKKNIPAKLLKLELIHVVTSLVCGSNLYPSAATPGQILTPEADAMGVLCKSPSGNLSSMSGGGGVGSPTSTADTIPQNLALPMSAAASALLQQQQQAFSARLHIDIPHIDRCSPEEL